jgi:hypothetical protein
MTTTLAQVRPFVAVELGGEGVGGFLSSTATVGSSSVLTDSKWPANTTLDVAEQWQDAWILRPAAASSNDRLRIVSQYTPGGGSFSPDLNWGVAPAVGEVYEIHPVLEPVTALNRCVNAALQRMMVETEFSFTPIGGANWHGMSQVAPWLTNRSWVREVGWLNSTESRNEINPYQRVVRGEAVERNGSVFLSHPEKTFGARGQTSPYTVYVHAMVPAYYACSTSLTLFDDPTSVVTTGSTWTITLNGPTAGMQEGQILQLSGFTPSTYNGQYVIIAVPSSTTVVVASSLQPAAVTVFGLVSAPQAKSGLSVDTDIAPVRTDWLGWVTINEAWRHYGQALDTAARNRLMPNRQESADWVTQLTRQNEKWPKLTFRPILAGGPLNTTFGGMPTAYRASTA